MSQPLDINSVCAWLRQHELEFHHAKDVINALSSGVKSRLEQRGDTADEILDKTEALDAAAESMDFWQMTEQPYANSAAESHRQSVDFARQVVR
jgi:hypothetical protein